MDSSKAEKKSTRITFKSILSGKAIAENLQGKHLLPIAVIFFMMIFYIWNRYEGQRQMTKIAKLNKELRELRYRAVTQSSEVMGQSRQSQLKLRLNAMGIDLIESQTPPITLE
ncbi:MAG: FtsL-like putative cell division protein [Bacteroidales bacterium]